MADQTKIDVDGWIEAIGSVVAIVQSYVHVRGLDQADRDAIREMNTISEWLQSHRALVENADTIEQLAREGKDPQTFAEMEQELVELRKVLVVALREMRNMGNLDDWDHVPQSYADAMNAISNQYETGILDKEAQL